MRKSGLRGWRGVLAGVAAAVMGLGACAGPGQYFEGTGIRDATVGEVAGSWGNIEDTRLTLRRDGTADFQHLDGQDFAFDDGWRVSGTGTWELTDGDAGQVVRLAMTTRTATGTRSDANSVDASVSAPATYRWSLQVDRDQHDALHLFFFVGDPDAGSTYVLTRGKARNTTAGR
ncbi:hypothetical protein [Streptomyces sp. NPDC059452]|uniref:hypothetical protein n=1 Tax=Streptomyces sp. NPDC059452 TaxID=3346835 RepID=UPI0036B7E54C